MQQQTPSTISGRYVLQEKLNEGGMGIVYRATDRLTQQTIALELLEIFPDTPERASQELQLQLALTGPLITTKGYGAPDTVQAFDRARQLAAQTGDTSQVFPLLYGKWVMHIIRAEHRASREVGEQFLALAQQQPDTGMLLMGHRLMGVNTLLMGELQSGHNHFEQALALFAPEQHQALAFRFGQHPGAAIQGFLAWTLWYLGYPDHASPSLKAAISTARELNHINTLCYVLTFCAGFVNLFRRDGEGLAELTRAIVEIAEQHGLALWLAYATVMEGWTMVKRGQPEAGVSQMLKGLTDLQATGTKLAFTTYWGLLAEGYAALGQTQEGLNTLNEALAFVEETDERYWEAEIHRLKGELLLMEAAEAEAEASFQQAIAIARQQEGKSLELRATVSLARLWQSQGKGEEARQTLADIYNWFTEGFDTVDLKEAKALLDELA